MLPEQGGRRRNSLAYCFHPTFQSPTIVSLGPTSLAARWETQPTGASPHGCRAEQEKGGVALKASRFRTPGHRFEDSVGKPTWMPGTQGHGINKPLPFPSFCARLTKPQGSSTQGSFLPTFPGPSHIQLEARSHLHTYILFPLSLMFGHSLLLYLTLLVSCQHVFSLPVIFSIISFTEV